jgi:hypothetical protein
LLRARHRVILGRARDRLREVAVDRVAFVALAGLA